MRFEYLNTEKHLDTLTIGNGTNPNKKKTAVLMYSGFETPETFEGVFHQMWIRFRSDIKNQFGGFSLTIEPRPYVSKCNETNSYFPHKLRYGEGGS